MILGVFSSDCVTTIGAPLVVARKILVIENTAVRNPEEEIVASIKIILKMRFSVWLISKLAVIAIENPPKNTEIKMKWLASLFQYSKGNSIISN